MNMMEILQEIDGKASEANALWNSLERLKYRIARESGISQERMKLAGIFVPEESQEQSNG